MHLTLVNLLGVAIVAFCVPFVLGLFPRVRIPSLTLELVAGIIIGPAVLGWIEPGPVVSVIASIGVAFLLFLAGLELDLHVLKGTPLVRGSLSFLLSFALAYLMMMPLGERGLILSPLLVAIALSATSVGILVPILRDTGHLDSRVGHFTLSGASAAEVGTIGLLGVFFAGTESSAAVSALLLVVVVILALLLLAALRYTLRWTPGQRIFDRLDDSSAQARVRFSIMILVAAATLAMYFGFEGILGTFVAGIVVGIVVRGDRYEHALRSKLKVIGFGLFVPAFFVTSGLRFELDGVTGMAEIGRAALFFVVLIVIRTIPALLYRPFLTWRECVASGLLQSTNLSFIVVAVAVGTELGRLREINGSALILAGLASAVTLPAIATALLGGAGRSLQGPMELVQLREFGRRYTAAWCSQDAASVAACFAEGGSLKINDGAPSVGRTAIAAAAQGFMTAFPDMVVTMDGISVEGDHAVYRWTLTGTNTGSRGTGKAVRVSGSEEWTIDTDGLIAESKGHFDDAEYQRQLKVGFVGD
jgi:Kef-type K+ transport system membrane component KefB